MSNQRIHRLMKEHKIPQISIPKLPEPVILSGVNDPMLPEQIAKDLKARDDILEVAYFPAYIKLRCQYRITFEKTNDFNMCMFYV